MTIYLVNLCYVVVAMHSPIFTLSFLTSSGTPTTTMALITRKYFPKLNHILELLSNQLQKFIEKNPCFWLFLCPRQMMSVCMQVKEVNSSFGCIKLNLMSLAAWILKIRFHCIIHKTLSERGLQVWCSQLNIWHGWWNWLNMGHWTSKGH